MIDYSIHFLEQEHLLIAHMRYIGDDYEGDMAQIGKSEATQKWWKVCRFLLGPGPLLYFKSLMLDYVRHDEGGPTLMSR